MQKNMKLLYFATNTKEEIESDFLFNYSNNTLNFKNSIFSLFIYLKEYIDKESFYNFLNKNNKKIILYCSLKKEDKIYKGYRKILWRNNNIAISLGGIRVEIEEEGQKLIVELLKKLINNGQITREK
ncbi:MAG: hypothetical protein QXE31_00220 [Candidatus Woesearchaeota archaeon]